MATKRRTTRKKNLPLYRRKKNLTTEQLKKIYFGDKKAPESHACIYCGKKSKSYHIDHKYPKAKSRNPNRKSNLVVACSRCNLSKADNTISIWLRRIRSSKKSSDKTLYRKIIKNNKGKRSGIAKTVRRIRDSKNKT